MRTVIGFLIVGGLVFAVFRLHKATEPSVAVAEGEDVKPVAPDDPALTEAFARVADALEDKNKKLTPKKSASALAPSPVVRAQELRAQAKDLDPQDFAARLEVLRELVNLGPDVRPFALELSLRILETPVTDERQLSDAEMECYREAVKVSAASLNSAEFARLARQIRAFQTTRHPREWDELLPGDDKDLSTEGAESGIQ